VGAANYEIRIKGRVSDSLLSAFEGLAVTTEPVETIVYGPLADQEAVHRLLIKLESLGLEVVEFRFGSLPPGGHHGVAGRTSDPEGVPSRPHERISRTSAAAVALVARVSYVWRRGWRNHPLRVMRSVVRPAAWERDRMDGSTGGRDASAEAG
jgi:hypothetical protein